MVSTIEPPHPGQTGTSPLMNALHVGSAHWKLVGVSQRPTTPPTRMSPAETFAMRLADGDPTVSRAITIHTGRRLSHVLDEDRRIEIDVPEQAMQEARRCMQRRLPAIREIAMIGTDQSGPRESFSSKPTDQLAQRRQMLALSLGRWPGHAGGRYVACHGCLPRSMRLRLGSIRSNAVSFATSRSRSRHRASSAAGKWQLSWRALGVGEPRWSPPGRPTLSQGTQAQ